MSTITTIQSSDLITNSRADINNNFSALNTDKMETSVLDTDSTLAADSDAKVASQKAVKAYIDSGGNPNASETVRGPVEEATDAEVTAGTATGATGAKLFITPAKLATRMSSLLKFGGTGADGALAITSGATNIDLGSAAVVIKNYTSISITGTGSLTFTNPHTNGTYVILKSQGNVTLTSSTAPMIVGTGNGSIQESSAYSFLFTTPYGGNAAAGAGGTAGGVPAFSTTALMLKSQLSGKYPLAILGAAGGQGTTSGGASGGGGGGGATTAGSNGANSGGGGGANGTGGRGGGVVIIECAGALNFTTASGLSANGAAGVNATGSAGGGGGGGGGTFLVFYNTLTANSGTITVAGGSGGTSGSGGAGGAGGNGYSLVAQNTEFT